MRDPDNAISAFNVEHSCCADFPLTLFASSTLAHPDEFYSVASFHRLLEVDCFDCCFLLRDVRFARCLHAVKRATEREDKEQRQDCCDCESFHSVRVLLSFSR